MQLHRVPVGINPAQSVSQSDGPDLTLTGTMVRCCNSDAIDGG